MLFKLSLKNISKSIKDYSIYFFTLVFAVAMFYMFNSLDAQESMLELTNSKKDLIKGLVALISYVSVFVSIVLGFLIVYSNNFLIRKRKKEIGLYFTLGMSKRKVSMILVLETIIIGAISLLVGLLCGTFLSQFLSIFTAKMFEVNITSFKFIFSTTALTKTVLYFSIIFILVMIFNVITLSRYKLIDLLNAAKKSEKIKFRNKYVTIISFILSITFIGYAYSLLFNNALFMMNRDTVVMLVFGALGTFLLFFSSSGFFLKVFEHIKKIYYKDLNMFALKQVNSKINTTIVSTTIICLMLLFTIAILSGAISMANIFNTDLKNNNLTDYTITIYDGSAYEMDSKGNYIEVESNYNLIYELAKDHKFQEFSKDYTIFHKYYDSDLTVGDMLLQKSMDKLIKDYGENVFTFDYNVPILAESEYKNLMKLLDQDIIEVKDNEYLLLANVGMVVDAYRPFYKLGKGITLNNTLLYPATDDLIEISLENSTSASNDGIIVVDDKLIKNLNFNNITIVGNYINSSDVQELENVFINYLENDSPITQGFSYRTKLGMEESSICIKVVVIFLGLYIGITFAITSATILAIGQLSEASDNKSRYKILRQIGADNKVLNKTLLLQISVSFVFPLVVALIHSYFGLKEINHLLISIGNIDLTSNILLTALFIIIIYGGYFLITYLCSKNIIKEK